MESLRAEIEGLLVLKAQLDSAMQRIRQRGGPSAARAPAAKTAPERGGAAKPDNTPPAETKPDEEPAVPAASNETVAAVPAESEIPLQTVAVIHIEDRPDLQDAVQATIASFSAASYHTESALSESLPGALPLVVLNLVASGDPLEISTKTNFFARYPRVFAYATDGTRGFVLGAVEIFAPPFEPAACARRILALGPPSSRVLVVSEAVLGTPELRAHLVSEGGRTSIAFDERQALGLIPSVRPNFVLIDLNLPRGEGLRLAARIRADERNRSVRIGFMWQEHIDADAFRQFAGRATLDFHFAEDTLRRYLTTEFAPGGAAYISPQVS